MAASIFMRFPDGRAKALTLSYDDGVIQDIRLMDIFRKNGLKATFNINSGCFADREYDDSRTTHRRLTLRNALALYKDSGFEVASHSVSHPFLEQLPLNRCTCEIAQDRISLEEQFGCMVRGFAYPYGTYSGDVIRILADSGICYARTVNSTGSFDIPDNWLVLDPTCHHEDPRLPELINSFLEHRDPFNGKPRMFYMWGHSYEFDFHDNWHIIEDFAQKMSGHDDIWYATNIEIYDYVQAYRRLIFNSALDRVYNPSATDLYFCVDNSRIVRVPAGAAVDF